MRNELVLRSLSELCEEIIRRTPLTPEAYTFGGLHELERLVQQYGPQILLDFPKRWQDIPIGDGT